MTIMHIELTADAALNFYISRVIDRDELRQMIGLDPEKPRWRVGDTVEGSSEYRSLPVGTVVGSLRRTTDGFVAKNGVFWGVDDLYSQRKITHLPN